MLGELALVAAALAAIGWGAWLGVRAIAVRTARALPPSVDDKLAWAARKRIDATAHVCGNRDLQAAVRELAARIARVDPTIGPVEVKVIRDDSLNAFALPGAVYVHTGLLARLDRPEELAGVLGHELGHVALRHGLVAMVQNLGLTQVVAFVFGWDSIVNIVASRAADLTALAYSREMEAEADDYGVATLRKAEIDPGGLPQFFGKLAEQEARGGAGLPRFLTTHPAPADRRARLQAAAAAGRTAAPLPPLARLQAPCD